MAAAEHDGSPDESDALRHHAHLQGHVGAFGSDTFGRAAERFARFFGTPTFILGQTAVVVVWIAVNVLAVALQGTPTRSSSSTWPSPPRPPTRPR